MSVLIDIEYHVGGFLAFIPLNARECPSVFL